MIRWTDLATWRGPTPNRTEGGQNSIRGLVVHIAEGYFEGTIAWCKNPDANVSSNWVGGREGGRAQLVDLDDAAWTQRDGNGEWVSIEEEGFTLGHPLHKPGWEKLTAHQLEFTAQIFARLHLECGVPLQLAGSPAGRGLGYHSMGAEHGYNWGHNDCPGDPIKAQLPLILARAIEIVNGNGDDIMRLYRIKGQLAVWAYDGCGRRWVPNSDALKRLQTATGVTTVVDLASQADLDLIAPLPPAAVPPALAARLDPILAAALDDGDVTVVMDEASRAELAAIRADLAAVPAAVVGEFAHDLADGVAPATT